MRKRAEGRPGERPGDLGKLVGLPQAQPYEAPSSWLTRAALSQGIRPRELLEFMGFRDAVVRNTDPDLLLTSRAGRAALLSAGKLAAMPIARKVFDTLRLLDSKGEVFLRDESGRARSRYCPACFRDQRVRHIELHWRFAPWRHCPLHGCLMEEHCAHCRGAVVLPFDMASSGKARSGVAYVSDCQHCGGKLEAVLPVQLESLSISEFDRARLSNGRALMSALYHGRARVNGGGWEHPLRIGRYIRIATFWKPGGWYSPEEIRAQAPGPPS